MNLMVLFFCAFEYSYGSWFSSCNLSPSILLSVRLSLSPGSVKSLFVYPFLVSSCVS